jgi:hypothetical protein
VGYRQLAAPEAVWASDGAGTGGVWVAWSPVPEALGYEVWRGASAAPASAKRLAAAAGSNYLDLAAPQGVLQWYWVKATNAARVSPFSPSNTGYRLLGTPEDINATDGSFVDKVRVTWKAVPNAAGYEVWRALDDDLARAACVGAAAGAAYDDEDTADGVTNFFWVRATNALCAGGWSASDSGFRRQALQPPAAPRNVSASDGAYTDKVRITWKTSGDAASYRVYRSAPDLDTLRLLGETRAAVFDDVEARPGVTYAYQVAGRNAVGVGAFSAPDLGRRGGAAAPPPPPAGISASDGLFPDRVVVTWRPAPEADAVEVWRGLTDALESAVRIATVETRAFEDLEIVRGARYYYWLRARNEQGTGEFSVCDAGHAGAPPVRVAATADYDGDGVSDLAVFHSESGEWFVRGVAGEVLAYGTAWGGAGFLVLPGDYDGDGANDFAAYDPAAGAWYIADVDGEIILFAEVWGGPGWVPVAGDYDGDGLADLAVYEPATGLWNIRAVDGRILLSGATWGGEGFRPVAAQGP